MKHVIVSGTSRGLGAAPVEGFQQLGWRVSGCSRSSGLDIGDYSKVKKWAKKVLSEQGAPDLLLNNAALINANAPLWEVPEDEFASLLKVNLGGTFHLLKAFLPAMIENGRGVVVNFSSTWGRTTAAEVAPYCCTKWGIEGLTRSLAQDLPKGLAAVAFNPGIIHTDMLRSCFGEGASHYPSPEVWARLAVPFLAGLGSKHNGQSLSLK